MEQDALEVAVQAIEQGAAADVQEALGLPSNGRVITNSLMVRVNQQTEGALRLKADMEDTQFYYEAIIRVCNGTEMQDSEDGWGIPKGKIDTGELLAAFGIGATGLCVASFDIESKQPVGSRSRQGAGKALGNKFTASMGSLVQFVDQNETVHRAAIVSFMLYVPKAKGTNLGVEFGGQTVLLAYVFDSTTVSTHYVVRFCHSNPVPPPKSHSFCVPQHRRSSCP